MINSCEYLVPGTIKIAELRQRLKIQFPFKENPSNKFQRHYLDSFDWRLYKKQWVMMADVDQSLTRLHLIDLASNNPMYSGEQSELPVFTQDINLTALRRNIAPILDVRALQPRVSLLMTQYHLSYLDKDGKTRLNVFIEDARLQQANGKHKLMGKRVRLEAVKGYRKPFLAVKKYLEKDQQFQLAENNQFSMGLAALKIQPGEYSSKLNIHLDAEQRTDDALKKILLYSLDIIEQNEQGVFDDIDTEYLHDFRVSVRRTRSVLSLIKQTFSMRVLQRFKPAFSWLGSITGPTRDMHVYLLKFDSYQKALPKKMQTDLEPLKQFLISHQKLEHKKLIKQLNSHRYKTLKHKWREFLISASPQHTQLKNAQMTIKDTADSHIWKAYRRLMKQGSAITDKCPDEKLHRLRITSKKLRYLLEFFRSMYPQDDIQPLISSLKKLQNNLGDFQDLSVQIESLTHFEHQMQDEGVVTNKTDRAINYLVKHFEEQIAIEREKFKRCFKQFSQKNIKTRFAKLFQP